MRTTTMRCLVAGLAGAVALAAWAVVAGCEDSGNDRPGSTARAVSCASDGNCPEAALCVDGYCMPLCTADADCPAGRCVEGVCDFAPEPWVCGPGAECPAGAVCVGGACKSEPGCGRATEVCNGIDDDCDGNIDEGFDLSADPANCGVCGSVCPAGERCADSVCTGGCVPYPELCNGLDDDCDGVTDEEFTCQQGATGICTTSCGSTGMRTCGSDCTWGSCEPPVEVCNGLDDDCDGLTDEGLRCGVCGNGVVEPGEECDDGNDVTGDGCEPDCRMTCVPVPEICNGLDDDCDGTIDEEGACACPCSAGMTCCADVCRNLASDSANCGACGVFCPAGERCAAGVCVR